VLGEVAMATALAAIKIARNLANSGVAFCALLNLAARLEECFDLRVDVLGFHPAYSVVVSLRCTDYIRDTIQAQAAFLIYNADSWPRNCIA